ncbi:imidazoleglycerol-phosphate dehydratase HisB [Eubacteriales bacterium OttesenSCG-928-K08]|nr:imidazoleglycerol-phosphate dehydratase HisB [Eubacteriales bacterium OttesenSCG-928-K08]
MKEATLSRKTNETDINLTLKLDGAGQSKINSGSGFFDHMLTLFAKHGLFDIELSCKGDVDVDYHHSVEDIGIVLGAAFSEALGDGRGIRRYGNCTLPMDEALVDVALDISGRAYLNCDLSIPSPTVGNFDTELVEEFLLAFCRSLKLTLHVRQLAGKNAHHIIEAVFKGLGRALRKAVEQDERLMGQLPSTKGLLL